MTLLLDTHLLLWAAAGDARLSTGAIGQIEDPANELAFSVASLWEIVIKSSLGRQDFEVSPHILRARLLENGYTELPISGEHALAVAGLPDLHRDPFDRILVAQATAERWVLLTSDSVLASYPGPIKLV